MKARLWLAVAATTALTLGACTTTRVASAWHDPTAQTADLDRILVVAMVPREAVRRNFELSLARELNKTGAIGVPSYRYVEDSGQMSSEKLKELAAQQGFDAVLVARYAGTEVEADYVPSTYYDYVGWSARYLYGPAYYGGGYLDIYEVVNLDTRLFDVDQGGKLIWAAVTETTDGDYSIDAASRGVARKIVERIDKDTAI